MEQIASYDLHVHTKNSDGENTIPEIAAMARAAGLSGFAITDHDTVGSKEEEEFANLCDLDILLGVEFATDISNMHFTAYMRTWQNNALRDFLEGQRRTRRESLIKAADKANEIGVAVDKEVLFSDFVNDSAPGRPHLAAYLVHTGAVKDREEAFSKYLDYGKPLYMPKERIHFKELIKRAHSEFNCLIFLAHPFLIRREKEDILKLIDEIVGEGVDGLEAYYPKHSPEETKYLLDLCEKHGLLVSGGSDFHGLSIKPDAALGKAGVDETAFEKIRQYLK